RERHAARGRLEHFVLDHLAVVASEFDRDFALTGEGKIGCAVLVAISMTADDDRLRPAGDKARNVPADNWFAEDHTAKDVADGAIRGAPHFLEMIFFNTALIGGNGRALHADADFLDHFGGIDSYPILCLVAIFDAEIVIKKINIQIRVDQLVFDQFPDDAG